MRLNPSKTRLLYACASVLAACVARSANAANDIYKVGSWVSYKMDIKQETPAGGGAAATAMAGPDPSMLAMLPPEKRAQIEAQLKQAQAQQGAMLKGGPGGNVSKMMSDMGFKMKLSVVGAEKREGKDCIWLEMSMSGKMPDMDKMVGGMMASIPAERQAEVKASMAKAKEKMSKMPMVTKDGRIKLVTKILVEKPDPEKTIELKPIEVWKKQGDHAVVQLSMEDAAKFGRGESDDSRRTRTRTKDEMAMHSETSMHANLMSDEKRAEVEETADKVGQVAKLGKSVATVIPGGQVAAAGLGVLSEISDMTKDIANLSVDVKATLDVKAKTDIKTDTETKNTTRLVSAESKVIGPEQVELPTGAAVKAAHTQAMEIRERVSTTKSKMDAKVDMNVKMDMQASVGVDGGAQSKAGKVLGAAGKGMRFVSDPFGRKKKKAEQAQEDMSRQMSDQTSSMLSGMETTSEMKTRQEEVKDYWISPAIPAMGLAKMVSTSQEKDSETSTSMNFGQQPGMDQMAVNPMAGMGAMGGMGGRPKQAKPKMITEMIIEQMGSSGARSEM